MKKFAEQLRKQAEGLGLKASERTELRERLLAYMEYHPLQEGQSYADAYRSSHAKPSYLNGWLIGKVFGATATFCLIVIPVLAEKSLPGDVLYPVKVSFNEELMSNFANSPYEQVEWETTLLQRRISEARLLASEGKLTPDREAGVAAAVRQHSDAAQAGIAAIRATDSEEAVIAEITFASALEVQSEVLEGHAQRDPSTSDYGRSIDALSGAVNEVRDVAVATQSGEPASYQKLSARVELETTRAEELFSSINGSASDEEIVSIKDRLTSIQAKINEAAKLHDTEPVELEVATTSDDVAEDVDDSEATTTEDIATTTSADATTTATLMMMEEVNEEDAVEQTDPQREARALLRQALTDTQKLISFMTNIDVRLNVSIDELVPSEKEEEVDEDETESDEEDISTSTEETLKTATGTSNNL